MPNRRWLTVALCALLLAFAASCEQEVTSVERRVTVTETRVVNAGMQQRQLVAAPAMEEAATAAYSGNTHTYKFHRSSCTYAGCPNCTARFATRDEAIAAGYRPCGTCKP